MYSYKSSANAGFEKQIIPILLILCYNGNLATWRVVRLTTAKLKPLIFSMSGFVVSYTANMFILMILYDFCLSYAQFCYIIVYIRKVESRAKIADRCATWKIHEGDIPSIQCKMNLRGPKSMRKVDGLSLIFIDFYVPALTPRLNSTESSLQRYENATLFALTRLSLYSLGTDRIQNTAPNSSIVIASRCLAMARLFIEPLPCNGQCLSSHVTILWERK
jgi:hypothetical protein